jgi:hypothetical protein
MTQHMDGFKDAQSIKFGEDRTKFSLIDINDENIKSPQMSNVLESHEG